jgi:hypothetical protein
MRNILIILSIFFFHSCTKPKSVLICGDHVCVNKSEAKQYFEENLSIEVKIINKKKKNEIDLVELNLRNNSERKREITMLKINKTNKEIKILNNEEIEKIKNSIKINKNKKKLASKSIFNKKELLKKNIKKIEKKVVTKPSFNKKSIIKKNIDKKAIKVVDICTILEKCSIDEISKYLLKKGSQKDFPDITARE